MGWGNEIGEDIHRHRQVLVEHLHVIAGVLLGGKGVELAADGVHFLGDTFGSAPLACP